MFSEQTKKYLLEGLNKNLTENIHCEFLRDVRVINEVTGPGGGAGVGAPAPSSAKKSKKASDPAPEESEETREVGDSEMDQNILFGNSNINWAGAMGMYAGGKALEQLADMAETGIGKFASGAVSRGLKYLPKSITNLPILGPAAKFAAGLPPQLAGAMLRNLADLSGANMFDANVKNIGTGQLGLSVQGAGKPFVPIQVPKGVERGDSPADRALAAAKREEEAKKYRGLGYSIP